MHAQLPAGQILAGAQSSDWGSVAEVIHECDRYPFVYPTLLAGWQAIVGLSQAHARQLGVIFFVLLVLAAMRLGSQLVRSGERPAPVLDAALLVGLAAVSAPLARRYGPTLFLEVPALTMIAFTLSAWISRQRSALGTKARLRWDLVAGVLVTVTFFTKFNYALLLGIGLAADAIIELGAARFRRDACVSLLRVGAPFVLGLLWWFALPLPFGGEVAAEHRADFMDFVGGNREMTMAMWHRAANWLTGVAAHSFVFVALGVLALVSFVVLRSRAALTMGLVLLAFVVPVVEHPFQLDRFLLPAALALWVLGGAGAALFLSRSPAGFTAAAAVLGVACANVSVLETAIPFGFPIAAEGTAVREFQEFHVGTTLGLFGPPASNGLELSVHAPMIDMIAEALGPDDSVAWLGQSSEVSPAALHLGLLERDGSLARFLEYGAGPMDIEPVPTNLRGEHTPEEILAFARSFDAVIITREGDMVGRPGRAWIPGVWHAPLRQSEDAQWTTLGSILVDRPLEGPFPVTFELVRFAPTK